jgi:Skp family chaperone for outer membrane proteins
MKFARFFLIFAAVTATASLAEAQTQPTGATAQAGSAKIGIVNSAMFMDEKAGITRLTNALKALDTEFKPRRDEINALVTRLNGINVPANATPAQRATAQDQAQTLQLDIRRKQEDARAAYAKRLSAVTDPIRLSVFAALEAYARQRGIDMLIDVAKLPDTAFLVNKGADLTPAFIRDYNTRNP